MYCNIYEEFSSSFIHLPPDKMAVILQTIFPNALSFSNASWMKVLYFDSYFTEVYSKRPINNKSALVRVMAGRRIGDKPLSEPMLTWFTDAYIWH